jgi:hypothetical protein
VFPDLLRGRPARKIRAQMAAPTIGQQVLERVVRKLGGPEQAARRLGVSATLLERFLKGGTPVPDAVLLKAVDCVLDSGPPEPIPPLQPASPPPKGPIVI